MTLRICKFFSSVGFWVLLLGLFSLSIGSTVSSATYYTRQVIDTSIPATTTYYLSTTGTVSASLTILAPVSSTPIYVKTTASSLQYANAVASCTASSSVVANLEDMIWLNTVATSTFIPDSTYYWINITSQRLWGGAACISFYQTSYYGTSDRYYIDYQMACNNGYRAVCVTNTVSSYTATYTYSYPDSFTMYPNLNLLGGGDMTSSTVGVVNAGFQMAIFLFCIALFLGVTFGVLYIIRKK